MSVTLREQRRFRVFEERMLRRIYGPKGENKKKIVGETAS
jgi:hypothetical protein